VLFRLQSIKPQCGNKHYDTLLFTSDFNALTNKVSLTQRDSVKKAPVTALSFEYIA
jgi:hypothetical protein